MEKQAMAAKMTECGIVKAAFDGRLSEDDINNVATYVITTIE